ncbi:hypothetical protein CEXT_629681 [Caerostris extrusa]|uniref:Uncharacterized protein n=1 Tax=Caerostris extrusa TaxID=172846 RepID=A0AAV4Y7L0_CAEEX|nr:hypothetical protein CEXT_629681 [Caerostris extrusa]
MPLLENIIIQSRLMDHFRRISGRKRRMVKEKKQSCVGGEVAVNVSSANVKRKKREKKMLEENKISQCQKDGKENFWGPPLLGFLPAWMFSLEEHGGKILVLEQRCHRWRTSSSSQDLWITSKGYLESQSAKEKSWFWSIDAIAGENHLPVKIYGHFNRISGRKKRMVKKKGNHVLGRGTNKKTAKNEDLGLCGVWQGSGQGVDDDIAWREMERLILHRRDLHTMSIDIGLVWKRTEEKSWFWSIDVIAGEHHLPVNIYGPLQRDIWT